MKGGRTSPTKVLRGLAPRGMGSPIVAAPPRINKSMSKCARLLANRSPYQDHLTEILSASSPSETLVAKAVETWMNLQRDD